MSDKLREAAREVLVVDKAEHTLRRHPHRDEGMDYRAWQDIRRRWNGAMEQLNAALADSGTGDVGWSDDSPRFREYGTVSEDVMRELRLDPSKHEFPDMLLQRLPKILRLGAGDETSLATKLMRAAADEIDNLRITADAPPEPTEEMVEALARHRQKRQAAALKTERAWDDLWPSVRDDLLYLAREDLRAALGEVAK